MEKAKSRSVSVVREREGTLEIICVFVQNVNSRTNKLVRRVTDMSFSSTFLSDVLKKSAWSGDPNWNTSTALQMRTLTTLGGQGRQQLSDFGSRILSKARDKDKILCPS